MQTDACQIKCDLEVRSGKAVRGLQC